jgi:hypothetical protein
LLGVGNVWNKTNKIRIVSNNNTDNASNNNNNKDNDDAPDDVAATTTKEEGITGDNNGDDSDSTDRSSTSVSETEYRYLPYLPLWWPEIDIRTGKARELVHPNDDTDDVTADDDYYSLEARDEGTIEEEADRMIQKAKAQAATTTPGSGVSRVVFERVPLEPDDKTSN